MQRDGYKICIDVPNPESICFIAMPFGNELTVRDMDKVCDVISEATNRISGLQPYRTDKLPGLEFTTDISEKLRAAKIVVAVCSPEKVTGKPNPNVMYELGIAHALGKATVIMTTDKNSIPADLYGKYYEYYTEEDVDDFEKRKGLADRIEKKMRQILDRMKDESPTELIDPEYLKKGIEVDRDTFCSNIQVRNNLKTIISYIFNIQHHFPEICGILNSVQTNLQSISDSGITERSRIDNLENDWLLVLRWKNIGATFMRDSTDKKQQSDQAFTNLMACAHYSTITEAVMAAKTKYDVIVDKMNRFPNLYEACEVIVNKHGGNYHFLQQAPSDAGEILIKITELNNEAKTVVGHSNYVIAKLIELID